MKFYLVKNCAFSFDPEYQVDGNGVKYRSVSMAAKIAPKENKINSSQLNCDKLTAQLEGHTSQEVIVCNPVPQKQSLESAKAEQSPICWKVLVALGLDSECYGANLRKSFVRVYGDSSGNCLERIRNVAKMYGFEVKVRVEFKNIGLVYKGREIRTESLSTKKTPLSNLSAGTAYLQCNGVYVSGWGCVQEWHYQRFSINGRIDIEVVLKKGPGYSNNVPFISEQDIIVTEKLLNEQIATDLTILPGDGSPVKCHKAFLLAHSPVFETMFKGSFEESNTNTIEMPDMTEKAVRALLKYLYLGETKDALECSETAFELLQTGHKYAIQDLEDKMKTIFLSKPDYWFDVEVAIRLFMFARNADGGKELMTKTVNIIKLNHKFLGKSENYNQLFKIPEVAMELFQYAISN